MAETHEIVVLKPKLPRADILRLTGDYFNARGHDYDNFDSATPKRDLFTESVNHIVAASLAGDASIKRVLSIACGTGRREVDIAAAAGRDVSFVGVEVSAEMARIAAGRGLSVVTGAWPHVELPQHDFDAALILSAFGHLPDAAARGEAIRKLAIELKPGAVIFLDVLNLYDRREWGPRIQQLYLHEDLAAQGYEEGDLFYRKIGSPEICFYHYFKPAEIEALLEQSGFSVQRMLRIGYAERSGEILDTEDGALFVEAVKRGI